MFITLVGIAQPVLIRTHNTRGWGLSAWRRLLQKPHRAEGPVQHAGTLHTARERSSQGQELTWLMGQA